MSRQTFTTTDVLRLEVEVPPTGLTNLVSNPNGALGAWGWITPVSGSFMEGAPAVSGLRFTAPNPSVAAAFTTEPTPIAAGQYASAAWTLVTISGYVRVRFEWLSSSYGLLSSSTQSGYLNTTGALAYAPQQAPASTAFVRLRFDHYSNTSGAAPSAGAQVTVTNVKVAKAATSGALGSSRTNLVANPSLEVNTSGWAAGPNAAVARSTAAATVGTASLRITTGSNPREGSPSATINIGVTGGHDYTFQFKSRAATTARVTAIGMEWFDAGGNQIGSAGALGATNTTSGWTLTSMTATAPSTATLARLRVSFAGPGTGEVHYVDAVMVTEGIDLPAYFDGATAASGTKLYTWTGTAHNSASTLTDSTLGSLVPTNWRNVLGPTHDIKVERESLNLGILTATILDATLDPSQTDQLRPGRRTRLLALVADVWEPLFTGKATKLEVTYDEKAARPRPPRISLAAVDPTQPLTAARRPDGVATIPELPFVLEGAGVPWRINGSGNQIPTANVVATNDNATALDQIAITRDTALGYAYVDRYGVLVAQDNVPSIALPNGTFDVNANGWTGETNTTIARVTTPVRSGAGSLRMTRATSTGSIVAVTPTGTSGFPVVGGAYYEASAYLRAATTPRDALVSFYFYNAAGAFLSGAIATSTVVDTTTGWTKATHGRIAPPSAAYVAVLVWVLSAASGEIHYIDDVTLAVDVAQPAQITEATYSDLDLTYSSEGCINSVNVKYLRYDATEGTTEEVVYGPYEDATSIDSWGRRAAEFVVQGIGEANVPAYAAKILARNANPELKAGSVLVPIAAPADLPRALWDLGDNARVKNTAKALDKILRVDQLTHTITPGKWLLELGFTGTASVASPQQTPPVQSSAGNGWINVGDPGAPAFANGWSNYGGGYGVARFRKLDGVVYLQGTIKSGVIGAPAFILPDGYRPPGRLLTVQFDGNITAGRLDIDFGGGVLPMSGNNALYTLNFAYPAD